MQPREAVRAPVLTAYTVVDEEQALRIVCALHLLQARVVVTPIGVSPMGIEVVALRHVRTRAGCNFEEGTRRLVDGVRITARALCILRRMGESRIACGAACSNDRQREGVESCRVHRCVARCRNGRLRRARQALVEVQLHLHVAAGREQRARQSLAPSGCQQRGG